MRKAIAVVFLMAALHYSSGSTRSFGEIDQKNYAITLWRVRKAPVRPRTPFAWGSRWVRAYDLAEILKNE